MTDEKKKKIISVLKDIRKDVEKDAADFDGQTFTGKTVGTYFGYHGAAIGTLADIIQELLEEK